MRKMTRSGSRAMVNRNRAMAGPKAIKVQPKNTAAVILATGSKIQVKSDGYFWRQPRPGLTFSSLIVDPLRNTFTSLSSANVSDVSSACADELLFDEAESEVEAKISSAWWRAVKTPLNLFWTPIKRWRLSPDFGSTLIGFVQVLQSVCMSVSVCSVFYKLQGWVNTNLLFAFYNFQQHTSLASHLNQFWRGVQFNSVSLEH